MQINELKIYNVNEWATVENYPYGFRKRCTLRAMIEETSRGQRLTTQTIYNGHENKPKSSTYSVGRFIATDSEGLLYQGSINGGKIRVYKFRGESEKFTFELSEENKKFIPSAILKEVEIKNKVDNIINNAWDNAQKKQEEKFKGLSDDDIKNHILNIKNWVVGGGGYYFKNGFARDYYKNVMVAFGCDFFNKSFTLENTETLRLTKKGKDKAILEAKEKLKTWLNSLNEDYIHIQKREDNYPTVQIGNTTFI